MIQAFDGNSEIIRQILDIIKDAHKILDIINDAHIWLKQRMQSLIITL